VTLSNQEVIRRLNRSFASGWKNIKGQTRYAGSSNTHLPSYPAMEVTNCAGHHNVQMIFLTSDGRVLHCLPGYWSTRDFLSELDLVEELGRLYYRSDLSAADRNRQYLDLHLNHALEHSKAMRMASQHQGFDRMALEKKEGSDFQRKEGFIASGLKTPDQVMHERMAERGFVPLESFNVSRFIDMGLKQYSYDYGVPGKGMPKKPEAKGSAKGKPGGYGSKDVKEAKK